MGIDTSEYAGHALAHWIAPARMHATESHKGWILRSADGDKLAEIMPRNDDNGNPTPEACATRALIADAPALLAEVVRLRESVTELAAALGAIIDGDATYSGDSVTFRMYPRHTANMQAIADARAVLAKHGVGK